MVDSSRMEPFKLAVKVRHRPKKRILNLVANRWSYFWWSFVVKFLVFLWPWTRRNWRIYPRSRIQENLSLFKQWYLSVFDSAPFSEMNLFCSTLCLETGKKHGTHWKRKEMKTTLVMKEKRLFATENIGKVIFKQNKFLNFCSHILPEVVSRSQLWYLGRGPSRLDF